MGRFQRHSLDDHMLEAVLSSLPTPPELDSCAIDVAKAEAKRNFAPLMVDEGHPTNSAYPTAYSSGADGGNSQNKSSSDALARAQAQALQGKAGGGGISWEDEPVVSGGTL